MISLKNDSVEMSSVSPIILFAIMVARDVYYYYDTELVITSCNDGTHSLMSLHYSGNAIDIRIKNLPDNITGQMVRDEIKERLNMDFDVVLESDHIHIEYQPRRR